MNNFDEFVANKYSFTEEELEWYIEKMGQLVDDNGDDEKQSAISCINEILNRRKNGN